MNFILNYLEIISNPFADEENLVNIMRSSISDLNQVDVLKINRALYIANYSKKFSLSIMDFLSDTDNLKDLSLSDPKKIVDFRDNILDFQTKASEVNVVEFFSYFIEKL